MPGFTEIAYEQRLCSIRSSPIGLSARRPLLRILPDSEAVAFASHEIDHIIAQKHGGLTEADNLALSCVLCNKQLNHPNRFVERERLLVTGILRVPN